MIRKVDGEANVIAEIEDQGATTFVDDDVEVGGTYKYMVMAKGTLGDEWVLPGHDRVGRRHRRVTSPDDRGAP